MYVIFLARSANMNVMCMGSVRVEVKGTILNVIQSILTSNNLCMHMT